MSPVIIPLGSYEVDGGRAGDLQRVVKLVGKRPYWLGDEGLQLDRFPEINNWEEGTCQMDLMAANFPGEYFPHFSQVQARLKGEPELAGKQLGGFSGLMSDGVWKNLPMLWERGIWRVYAPAPEAVWLRSDGSPCAPYVGCGPGARGLGARWVGGVFDDGGCFLLSRKVGKSELGS